MRAVVVDDSLGIGDELDARWRAHVDGYEDEWAATLRGPGEAARFVSFVNAPETPDPSSGLRRRAGPGPARDAESERTSNAVLVAGSTLEVRR